MQQLFENWRKFVNEVSYADAKEILNSKGTLKIIKNYEYEMKELYGGGLLEPTAVTHKQFKDWLLEAVPDDLTDNQKGTAVLWLRKLAKEDYRVAKAFIDGDTGRLRSKYGRLWDDFEAFFHHQRFMPQQDLMSVKTIDDLQRMVDEAKDEIHAAQEKKQYLDAGAGTEVLRDDDKWFIAALHNKGAACELGKGTNWCTAAPGLDYFEDYYEPDDPLFAFVPTPDFDEDLPKFLQRGHKTHPAGEEKYQFHYGSEQFMDKNDRPIEGSNLFKYLHTLLMQTNAPKKYPIVQNYHYNMIAGDSDTPPEQLAAIAEESEDEEVLKKIAKNAATPSETLKKLASGSHKGSFVGGDKSIIRNLQSNPSLDLETVIMIFRTYGPKDSLVYDRAVKQMLAYAKLGQIKTEEALQIISDVEKKRDPTEKSAHEMTQYFQESFARYLK